MENCNYNLVSAIEFNFSSFLVKYEKQNWFFASIEKILNLKSNFILFVPGLVSNAEPMPSTFIILDRKFVLDHQEHKSNIEFLFTLEECGLQGDRKLAVNGNISG